MKATEVKTARRRRRQLATRNRLRGGRRPVRLSVTRSLKHIYAQVIDDAAGKTVCAVGTGAKALQAEFAGKSKADKAGIVGREIARLAKEQGIETVVFDRGFCRYHGRVKALAEAARQGGLKF